MKNIKPHDCKEYLGDGVYWTEDGWHDILVAEGENWHVNRIYLDPDVLMRFVRVHNAWAREAGRATLEWSKPGQEAA